MAAAHSAPSPRPALLQTLPTCPASPPPPPQGDRCAVMALEVRRMEDGELSDSDSDMLGAGSPRERQQVSNGRRWQGGSGRGPASSVLTAGGALQAQPGRRAAAGLLGVESGTGPGAVLVGPGRAAGPGELRGPASRTVGSGGAGWFPWL